MSGLALRNPIIGNGLVLQGAAFLSFSNPNLVSEPVTCVSVETTDEGNVGVDISILDVSKLRSSSEAVFVPGFGANGGIWFKGMSRFDGSPVPGQKGMKLNLDGVGNLSIGSFKAATPFSLFSNGRVPDVIRVSTECLELCRSGITAHDESWLQMYCRDRRIAGTELDLIDYWDSLFALQPGNLSLLKQLWQEYSDLTSQVDIGRVHYVSLITCLDGAAAAVSSMLNLMRIKREAIHAGIDLLISEGLPW